MEAIILIFSYCYLNSNILYQTVNCLTVEQEILRATERGHLDIVKYFIEKGADVSRTYKTVRSIK